ncbi:class I SAM-dependent methyltransferase [Crateriforma conspicua]|uniref:dTDP-3-amino-3,4, 6-trideoxy-alpha-D-glucopyranose n=1 Tax=Crateriforma conspicua TaxID=2527996 RepID=A0A5C5Y878_9PLAN|nr:class I SAM-dependent methyltransferase [Crateriforma conspicua]QDV65779.1 Methyltransferase domain protein [Crateriforma conspicua]TWT71179.1 dTDP-3-amino-3,4,6-trideoxy-alpha-D-glucopyranose [Crateriforma conspicua]
METLDESIYDHPKYYDLVFGADCASETRFIMECGHWYADGAVGKKSPSKWRMFEPACGTGRLLNAFARKGHTVAGLDLNPKAVEFCNARFARGGFPQSAFVADMSDFQVDKPYDIAFNTINSFRHVASERAAKAHLDCMADAIRPGGLYLLGIHLTPTTGVPSETESWSARRGHLAINTHMWTISREPKKRIERFGIRFDVHTPQRSFRINDVLVLRSYTKPQMERLIKSSPAWEIADTFDFAYDIDEPIDVDASTEDVVYILRRKANA